MNKRIVELARQSGLKKDHASDREYTGDFDWREFAELIVQECLKVINQPNGVGDDDVIRISRNVKKHFGVEE